MEKGMKTFFNFRDLGNLLTEDGRKTPENTFFRSGNWDTASVEETDFLKSLGIKHVFDYRDLSESNGPAKAYSEANVNHNAFPTGVRNQKLLKLQKAGFIKKLRANVSFEDIEETYARLPFDNEGYKAMILAVKNHETPILQHCFAGKDRAGVGTALLLSLLGVKRDIIIEDYENIKENAYLVIPQINYTMDLNIEDSSSEELLSDNTLEKDENSPDNGFEVGEYNTYEAYNSENQYFTREDYTYNYDLLNAI